MSVESFNFFSDPVFRDWLVGTIVVWNLAYGFRLLRKNL